MLSLRTLVIATGVTLSWSAVAHAGNSDGLLEQKVPVTIGGIEIATGGGYTQGVGGLNGAMESVGDVAGAGNATTLKVGFRLSPNLALGIYGSGALYSDGDDIGASTDVVGATAGVYADWHFRPRHRVDPWLSLGAGWRGVWAVEKDDSYTSLQGIELAKVELGVDVRLSRWMAIAPVIGMSTTMFLSEHTPGMAGHEEIDDPTASVFFSAGIQTRFATFGDTVQ
jgi:hypothetical protein